MKKGFNPRVSIIIPVYNGSNFLAEAIDSALAQTYKNIEVIVVNDGSKDGGKTAKTAKSYGKKIRYFSKPNGGVSTALNYGIQKMRGTYFSWLSHDDLYCSDKISKQIEKMLSLGGEAVVFTDFDMVNEENKYLGRVRVKKQDVRELPLSIFYGCPLHGCTMLIPKKVFAACGLFDPKKRTTQDYDLWFRILEKFKFFHMSEALIKSRIHSAQGTLSMTGLHLKESDALYLEYLDRLSPSILDQKMFFKIADGLILKFCFKASFQAIKFARKAQDKLSLRDGSKYYFNYFRALIINFITIKAVLVKRKIIR